jgi:hypothetical protein
MYRDLSTEELVLLLEHSKRELILLTKLREKGLYGSENYKSQVDLLLDDINSLGRELKKRK